jgi:hypothetical protein
MRKLYQLKQSLKISAISSTSTIVKMEVAISTSKAICFSMKLILKF